VSYFEPVRVCSIPKPCVIYLHGNASSRLEGRALVDLLVPYDIAYCILDFAGCGLSGGDFISLGYFEKEDVY
jgi:hypothetical protein